MDLNLVRVFVEIYETRSLTTAASRLFVTQSAVSQSLARLRRALDDPLFERRGRLMEPTVVAEGVYPAFRDAMASISGVVDRLADFEPATSTRQFRIALSELGEVGWLANIVADLRAEAPHIRLHTLALQPQEVEDALTRGAADLAIAPAELPGELERTVIKTQTYTAVFSREHPLAGQPLTLEHYRATPRVVVAGDSSARHLEAVERSVGAYTEPAVVAQHYASVLSMVIQSPDLMVIAPSSLAHGWTRSWPVAAADLPFEMDPVRLALYRRPGTLSSASLDWLYSRVLRATVGLPTHFETMGAEELLGRATAARPPAGDAKPQPSPSSSSS